MFRARALFGAKIRKKGDEVMKKAATGSQPPVSFEFRDYYPKSQWTLIAASLFGFIMAMVMVQRMWPRRYALKHVDQDGNPVDPYTGRRI